MLRITRDTDFLLDSDIDNRLKNWRKYQIERTNVNATDNTRTLAFYRDLTAVG